MSCHSSPSGGKIDIYLDCNSPYSCFAYHTLLTHRPLLKPHNIFIHFHPIFLGGINAGSGNKPPWTLPAKALLSTAEMPRAIKYFSRTTGKDLSRMSSPPFFPILSLLPMRCMLYIQANFETETYERIWGDLWVWLWEEHLDISQPEILGRCLGRYFEGEVVKKILAAGKEEKWKKMLTTQTGMLVEKGAFGAPWLVVRNAEGREENFFGSDRFHFICEFLNVPFRDFEILPPSAQGAKL